MKYLFSTLAVLLLAGCRSSKTTDSVPAHDGFVVESTLLGESRTINVWTPPGYSDTQPLPVLYMLDGGVKEDFPHIAATLAEMVRRGEVPPHRLVGIENTQRRRDLTGPTEVAGDKEIAPMVGGSEAFRRFLRDELFPEVDRRYRSAGPKAIIGESLAGLFIVETLLLQPDLFDTYIAVDPSLWWNDGYLLTIAADRLSRIASPKRLWFAGSNAEDISKNTQKLATLLRQGHFTNLQRQYAPMPDESHGTIFRAAKEKALKWALNP